MIRKIARKLAGLCRCNSGNATMLVALGMPVLIGGAGLGVDLTQWYMWKRELQFAVDQAAVAGAWARAEEETEGDYITRAQQEFAANLSVTGDETTIPDVRLANFAAGTDNSVAVSASWGKRLPFSSILTDQSASIYAYAQASFEEGRTFTSCLIATDDDDYGAVTIGGSSILTASCGIAALSTNATAVAVNGNPTVDAGWILAAGGIDQWLKDNTDDIILEYMSGLVDPYKELTPPDPANSRVNRTYSCAQQAATRKADVSVRTVVSYSYYVGQNKNNNTAWNNLAAKQNSDSTTVTRDQLVSQNTNSGTTTDGPNEEWTAIGGSKKDTKWEKKTTTTTTTISNVRNEGGQTAGNVVPGTYSGIHVKCATTFQPGVYVIDGGTVKITGQHEVTGSSVMFVLKNGASIDISGGANINLTAIQASDLIADGIPADEANRLAGLMIFEDPQGDGAGQNGNKINGNSNTILNGTIYLPKSGVDFRGTAGVTSQCLMIAAATITIGGNANMSTFCPANSAEDTTVLTTAAKVRLVA
ncbi:TadE/TadG family type IV pilus assembly protein [Aurantiacibacter spongiae]|uniref:Putative Flp pilus-assembly TadG-like N-terminal domain-containing protein n=1 Tax=Aurantiacibacter spongiae TaxID=2488860 RepID=A0A3N5CN12_9SPHN|nr:pilus assembly protein TadG-related protein [Aurantiacibacter spongiae]RPF70334.1 hypothetical protein EG799_00825 [Aurantiacibacter spongiae]